MSESIKITIKNYRTIPFDDPLVLEIKDGICFILGKNNIGKSNILRFFAEMRGFFTNINQQFGNFDANRNLLTTVEKAPNFDRMVNRRFLNSQNPVEIIVTHGNDTFTLDINPSWWNVKESNNFRCAFRATWEYKTNQGDPLPPFYYPTNPLNKAYELFADSFYIPSFRTGLFGKDGTYYDVIAGSGFVAEWSHWSSNRSIEKAEQINKLQEELGKIFGYQKFIVSPTSDGKTFNVITDDGTFAIDELGSGISHIIICLGKALIQKPSFILIDEPETGLHPKMQEIFVRALASKAKYGLIASSHSLGLARSVADEILLLTKDNTGKRFLKAFGDYPSDSLIGQISELGYSQFAEIGGNNILLVEGRTDIKAFREILRKFNIEQHFIIWTFGGRNFVTNDKTKIYGELEELKRLNPNSISVIFDSERSIEGEPLRKELQTLVDVCEELEFKVFPTDVHSTENYLTQDAINSVLGNGFTALKKFEKWNEKPRWDKNKNWLIFREMSRADFTGTGLEGFITKVLMPLVNK